jgi:dienelactone hydrolase
VKEFPVFVPQGVERLAAVLALPEGEPRGLVVLSTGVGASRAHRFQVWAQLAERLAERQIASIRYEYLGMHDSTGLISAAELDDTPINQIRAVTRFAKEVVGVERVVAAGNCYGGHGSLQLAAEEQDCIGAVCILPRTVRPGKLSMLLHTMAGGRVGDFIRSKPALRKVARPLRRVNLKQREHTRYALPKALRHARVIFLIDAEHRRRMNRLTQLNAILATLTPEDRGRFELRVLPGVGLDRFGSLETQAAVLETLPGWIADRFDETAGVEAGSNG